MNSTGSSASRTNITTKERTKDSMFMLDSRNSSIRNPTPWLQMLMMMALFCALIHPTHSQTAVFVPEHLSPPSGCAQPPLYQTGTFKYTVDSETDDWTLNTFNTKLYETKDMWENSMYHVGECHLQPGPVGQINGTRNAGCFLWPYGSSAKFLIDSFPDLSRRGRDRGDDGDRKHHAHRGKGKEEVEEADIADFIAPVQQSSLQRINGTLVNQYTYIVFVGGEGGASPPFLPKTRGIERDTIFYESYYDGMVVLFGPNCEFQNRHNARSAPYYSRYK